MSNKFFLQAIKTKYLGPTNFRGSRVKAVCDAGARTFDWDDALNVDDNHKKAATKLAASLGWLEKHHMFGGGLSRVPRAEIKKISNWEKKQ